MQMFIPAKKIEKTCFGRPFDASMDAVKNSRGALRTRIASTRRVNLETMAQILNGTRHHGNGGSFGNRKRQDKVNARLTISLRSFEVVLALSL